MNQFKGIIACFVFFLLFNVLVLSGCEKTHTLSITSSEFARWFINPGSNIDVNLPFSSNNELLTFRTGEYYKARKDTLYDTLKDEFSSAYVIGYHTPETIRSDTLYPLIIYLHGGTGSPLTDKGRNAYQMLRPLADSMQLFLASPSANRYTQWWSTGGLSRILQTIRFMSLHYPIDPQKIFLAGVSDGATGCWQAANTIYGNFAGFFAISGFGGLLTMNGITLNPENISQRPIYNVNAGKDRLYPPEMVNQFLDAMESSGVKLIRKSYSEEEHGFDYREKEFGTLCSLIRVWKRPETSGIQAIFSPNLPMHADNLVDWAIDGIADSRYIKGSWKKDTLEISAKGISSAIITFPASICSDNFIFVNTTGKTKKVYAIHKRIPQSKAMLQSCIPSYSSDNFYQIHF
jgi:hypothetical protein